MKRLSLLALLAVALLASRVAAQDVQNTEKEKAAIAKQNEEFRRAHPPKEDSYKDTKQYKAQSAEEKKKTDAAVKASQEGVKKVREQQESKREEQPASSCPAGKVCAKSAR